MRIATSLGVLLLALPLRADPVITALTPDTGPRTGGTQVFVAGSGFLPDDEVVFAGPSLFSPLGDSCDDGFPVCDGNLCVLSEARGNCTINGVPGVDPFTYVGSGQIVVFTPSVGLSGSGPADVLIVSATGPTSNVVTFVFTPLPAELPPTISAIVPAGIAGPGCCAQGTWQALIQGSNFRRCLSVVLLGNGWIRELLPTPDVEDCSVRRGPFAFESPRERLRGFLPPDGGTIACDQRPELVPLRPVAPRTYRHDLICEGPVAQPFCPTDAIMLGSPGNEVTSGGAFEWINESQVRIHFGPQVLPACGDTEFVVVYLQTDPGRGFSGDLLSNGVLLEFTNTAPCPCFVSAQATAPALVCPGAQATIDASGSSGPSCVTGLEYEFATGTSIPCPFDSVDSCDVTVDTTSVYQVRVRCADDHSCSDETEVTIEVDPDTLPPDQGNTLRAVRDAGDVRLDFAAAPAVTWRIFADADRELRNLQPLLPDVDLPEYRDLGAIAGGDRYYQLRGLSHCSRLPGP